MLNEIFVGIDTSKEYVDVAVIDTKGQELMATKRYNQDLECYETLFKDVNKISHMTKGNVVIGMESTGVYHVPLYDFFAGKGLHVRIFNGLEIRGLRKTRIRKTKTDKIDAKLIANALRYCYELEKKSPVPNELRNLREFCRIRDRLIKKRTTIKNQLVRDLDLIFPGLTNLFDNKLGKKFMKLLAHACTPGDIQRMPIEILRKYISESKAERIKEIADNSQGAVDLDKAICFEIKSLVRQGRCIIQEVGRVEKAIEKEFNKISSPIKSIPGIGSITGAVIHAEIGDIRNFDNPKKIVGFAGLDPVIKESGKSKIRCRISKRGSTQLRWALYNAAFTGTRFNPVLKAYYEKKMTEGKHHNDAVVCCARKLCCIIYSVLKNNKPFYVPSNISSINQ
jgi:transposase